MKNISKSDSVLKKKGFYIALYSCIGVVLLLAAVISYYGLNPQNESAKQENPTTVAQNEPEINEVINPWTKTTIPEDSYLTPGDRTAIAKAPSITADNTASTDTTAKKSTSPTPAPSQSTTPNSVSPSTDPGTVTPTTPSTQGTSTIPANEQTQIEENKADTSKKQENNQTTDVKNVDVSTEKTAEFTAFTDNSVMQWPTFGEIVMDYSPDRVIYDVTLEQFRTNDSISIAAQAGAQVKASAEGVVKSVSATKEKGNSVVIDHGNGWETTYSQLQDSILVAEGDVVKTGQVIGGVGSPSIYSVLLGNHLDFKVSKENEKIDPKAVLAE